MALYFLRFISWQHRDLAHFNVARYTGYLITLTGHIREIDISLDDFLACDSGLFRTKNNSQHNYQAIRGL